MNNIITSKYPNIIVKRYVPNKKIDFPDRYFDYIFSITVLHHNPYKIQDHMISEIERLLSNSGKVIILESINIKDRSFNMYPNSLQSWVEKFESNNFKLEEYKLIRYNIIPSVISKLFHSLIPKNKRDIVQFKQKYENTKITAIKIFKQIVYSLGYLDPYIIPILPDKYAHAVIAKFVKTM